MKSQQQFSNETKKVKDINDDSKDNANYIDENDNHDDGNNDDGNDDDHHHHRHDHDDNPQDDVHEQWHVGV